MIGDRDKAMEAGCTGYIEKPIDPATFMVEVERYFPGNKSESSVPKHIK
jgi:CheY-like chemotaxis protein